MKKRLDWRLAGLFWLLLAAGLAACGDSTATGGAALPITPLPTVTPLPTTLPASTVPLPSPPNISSPTAAIATAPPLATATPPPPKATPVPPTPTLAPGSTIQINGVINQIIINQKNVYIIVVNNQQFFLTPQIVGVLGKRLVVGVPINFVARAEGNGQIIIINVVQINNQTVIVNAPVKKGGDDDDQGDDEGD